MDNNLPTKEDPRVPLVDLLEDPAELQKQLYKDALLALEAIRNEIAENGFLNTQKNTYRPVGNSITLSTPAS